jgi:hypothetical protein
MTKEEGVVLTSTGREVGVGLSRRPVDVSFGWRRAALLLVASVVLAGVWGIGQARAALPTNCDQSGIKVSCRFSFTGAPDQTFKVPAGISSVEIVAVGAPGGASGPRYPVPVPGGAGAVARGTLSVTGGQTLYVEVGGPGDDGFYTSVGGFNGGGMGDPRNGNSSGGGGGGGASDVRSAPYSAVLSPDPRLLVAGGGGGAGAPTPIGGGLPGFWRGGDGGAAGQQGASGLDPCLKPEGPGGGGWPGTASSGGSGGRGGTVDCRGGGIPGQQGDNGALGRGGGGSTKGAGGGGGGGGLYGGGQGGQAVFNPNIKLFDGTGGGGGGGSSLIPAGGSVTANTAALPPEVTISYTVAGGLVSTGPVQPRLKLSIAGPHAVTAGQIASYLITLSRTRPHNRRVYPLRNVRVVSKHAGRMLRRWLISTLPPGQSRGLRLKVTVPTTARGRFCMTTSASSKDARRGLALYCVPVVP